MTGVPKYMIITVPGGFLLGIVVGTAIGGAETRASDDEADEQGT